MDFADGVVNAVARYKRGFYFSPSFVGDHSWNGFVHNLLFERIGNKRFSDVARAVGVDEIRDSRAVVTADLNQDGRLDLVMQNNASTPTVYLNKATSTDGNMVQLTLVGTRCERDAIGTRVEITYIESSGEQHTVVRWVEAGNGYASQSPNQLHFGLGDCKTIQSLSIYWPDKTSNTVNENLDEIANKSISIRKIGDRIAFEIIQESQRLTAANGRPYE